MTAHACRAVCPVCLDPVVFVSGGGGPVMVDPEPQPAQGGAGNVLVLRHNGGATVVSDWESERTVVDQGAYDRRKLHRCERGTTVRFLVGGPVRSLAHARR